MYEREINRYLDRMVDGHQLASKDEWKGFRCVLFDMDGVLYNSMPNHAVAGQQAMSANGPKPSMTKRRDCFTRCPKPGYSMAS